MLTRCDWTCVSHVWHYKALLPPPGWCTRNDVSCQVLHYTQLHASALDSDPTNNTDPAPPGSVCVWSAGTLHHLHPPSPVFRCWSPVNLWWNSPARTEETDRKPSRSGSTAAADKPGLAILLLLLARLHILRGPSRTSRLPGWSQHPGRYRRAGGREEGTCCAGGRGSPELGRCSRSATTARGGGGGGGREKRRGEEEGRGWWWSISCSLDGSPDHRPTRVRQTGDERRRGGALLRREVSGAWEACRVLQSATCRHS